MSELTSAQIEHVARLARIEISNEEVAALRDSMGHILTYIERLNEVDTEGVEPMVHAIDLSNVFREDVVAPSLSRDAALSNAPSSDGRYFLVPAILDGDQ